jgi:hypothetical protein
MSSTNRGAERAPSDFYPTPHNAAIGMAREAAEINRGRGAGAPLIVDAGAGQGALTRAIRETIPEAYIIGVELEPLPVAPVQVSLFDAEPGDALTTDAVVRAAGADSVSIADFLTWEIKHPPRLVVSNPPFSLADAFIARTLDVVQPDYAAFLLRLGFLGGRERFEALWSKHPPDAIRVLIPRPDFTGGGGDSADYAWVWWSRPGVRPVTPPIGWYVDGWPTHGVPPFTSRGAGQ